MKNIKCKSCDKMKKEEQFMDDDEVCNDCKAKALRQLRKFLKKY